MFCRNCGGEIKNEVKFCPYCGTEVRPIEVKKEVENTEAKTELNNSSYEKEEPVVKPMVEDNIQIQKTEPVSRAYYNGTAYKEGSPNRENYPVKKENIFVRFIRVICALILSGFLCVNLIAIMGIVDVRAMLTPEVLSDAMGNSSKDFKESIFNTDDFEIFQKDWIEETIYDIKGEHVEVTDKEVAEYFEDSKFSENMAIILVEFIDNMFSGQTTTELRDDEFDKLFDDLLEAFEENFDVSFPRDLVDETKGEIEDLDLEEMELTEDEELGIELLAAIFSYVTIAILVVVSALLIFIIHLTRRCKGSSTCRWVGTNMIFVASMVATLTMVLNIVLSAQENLGFDEKFLEVFANAFINVSFISSATVAVLGIVLWIVSFVKKNN